MDRIDDEYGRVLKASERESERVNVLEAATFARTCFEEEEPMKEKSARHSKGKKKQQESRLSGP